LTLATASIVALLAGGSEGPQYPLGPLRLPPIAEQATPFRLVDVSYSFADDGSTLSSFQARIRAGGSLFVGGEVTGDRRGLFLDTQRVELGVSEENGDHEVEASFRATGFLLTARGVHEDGDWEVETRGSLRLSNDVEVLLSHNHDLDPSAAPPVGASNRELRGSSISFLYQRGSHLEALADARLSRIRTEAGFDIDLEQYRVATLWNPGHFELDGALSYESRSGRLASQGFTASLGIDAEVGSHVLAHASTLQRWEPGVLRFEEEYRIGATFFGRRHRFARRSEAASRVLELQRKANALGYNERRVYDLDGLRRFRERLGISPARGELKEALDDLYRAQVRDRNVPELGFEISLGENSVLTVERRSYRAFVGVPWPVHLPFLRDEDSVDFLQADFVLRQDDYPAGVRAISKGASLRAFLNRETSVFFRWEDPGVGPEEIILERSLPSRFTVGFEYAMGR
jgi:hypothetical protein